MNQAIIDSLQRRFGTANWTAYQPIRGVKYDTVRLRVTGTNQLQFFTNPIGAGDPNSAITPYSKTLEQTNLVKSSSFGQEYFALTQIRCHVNFAPIARQTNYTPGQNFVYRGYTATKATAAGTISGSAMEKLWDLMHSGILNISFGQKLYYQIQQPFISAPAGFGLNIVSMATSRTGDTVNETDSTGQNWWAQSCDRVESVYAVDPVQIIEPEVQITATIDFPDNNTPNFSTSVLTSGNAQADPIVEAMLVFDGYIIRPQQ